MENNEYPIVTNVKLEDLPSVITKTFNRISEIENKLKNAENNAKTAEKSANEAKQKSIATQVLLRIRTKQQHNISPM